MADEAWLTVDELAARAGITVRTLRFYAAKGLLPPPELGPRRVGRYGPEHLGRLELIEELQRQGLTLAAIERYLTQLPDDIGSLDLAVHRALVASWQPETAERITREQLERRAGRPLSDEDLNRLAAMGAILPQPSAGAGAAAGEDACPAAADDSFPVDPGLLPLGVRILDVPIPLETLVAARAVVRLHSRATAHDLHRLFRDTVWRPFRASHPDAEGLERMKELTAHIEPLAVQALVTAFQRSLAEELSAPAD
ncbi:MerR family transcriptional regulator [Streptacidiphilus melanogenes]|uniref:MerR family transcriptional regulator n=1 Tax=Streptacidiphilus melanogenes TaxID=411235 RepID=UPI0005AB621D|nr:MerR family transcriptional regulator [Streptacidiphilus melanogenes]